MKFEVLKRHIHYPLPWSKGFWGGRSKRGALVKKDKGMWQRNVVVMIFFMIFFCEGENEEKRRQKNRQTWLFPQNYPFWTYFKQKFAHIHFLVHGHSSWSTFTLHLVWDAKTLLNWFVKKSDHGCWIMKSNHGKRPSSMIQPHGPWYKPALSESWGEPTRTMVPWRQGFRHPTRNECMDWSCRILSEPNNVMM